MIYNLYDSYHLIAKGRLRSQMKILFIAPGDSLHTSRWIERVAREGIECVFFDMTEESIMHPLGLSKIFRLKKQSYSHFLDYFFRFLGPVGMIYFNLGLVFKYYKEINKVIKSEKPDLIHLHWLFHAASLATSFIKNVPIISTPWGSDLLTPEYKQSSGLLDKVKHKYVVRRVIRKTFAFCCDAPHMREKLVEFGANVKDIQIIYFGTDVNTFSSENRNSKFWEKFGLEDSSLKILSNRVLADMYDIETFIRASKIVNEKEPHVDFVIAGGGPQSDKLKSYAESFGSKKGITFTGRLNDHDFAMATNSCDIYVSTSPTDGGIAASVAEAMSAEIPVIITDFGDNQSWLRNQTAGYIFAIGDSEKLAELIFKFISSQTLRKTMGRAGRSIIIKDNNSAVEIVKIVTLYNQVVFAPSKSCN